MVTVPWDAKVGTVFCQDECHKSPQRRILNQTKALMSKKEKLIAKGLLEFFASKSKVLSEVFCKEFYVLSKI